MLTVRTHSKSRKFQKGLRGLMAVLVMLTASGPLPNASAQGMDPVLAGLPPVGTLMGLTPSFTPLSIRGLTVHPENPLEFDFIIDTGDEALLDQEIRDQSTRLVKYFLAAMTVPEDEFWVNLSPYEANRVISPVLGATEMGRDLLAQDYLLKQLAASLMSPEEDLGATFWENVQERLRNQIPGFDHTLDATTLNKIWIVPGSAVVYEHENHAFVLESRLQVMMESDYLARKQREGISTFEQEPLTDGTVQEETSTVMRQWLLPAIEKEVNEGAVFANLRQIYAAMILATWYKQNLWQSLLGQVYADQSRIRGVDVADPTVSEKIYQRYLESFRQGVYDYIKDEYDPMTQSVVSRKYFSGGKDFSMISGILERVSGGLSTLFGYGTQGVNPRGRAFSLRFRLEETSARSGEETTRDRGIFAEQRLQNSLSPRRTPYFSWKNAGRFAVRGMAFSTAIACAGCSGMSGMLNRYGHDTTAEQRAMELTMRGAEVHRQLEQNPQALDMETLFDQYQLGTVTESKLEDYLRQVTPGHFNLDSTLAALKYVVWNPDDLLTATSAGERRVSDAVIKAFQKAPPEISGSLLSMMQDQRYSARQRAAAAVMSAWLLNPDAIPVLGALLRSRDQPYWVKAAAARGLTMFVEAEKRGVVKLGGLVSIRQSSELRGLLDNARSMGVMTPDDARNIELAMRGDGNDNVDRVRYGVGEARLVVDLSTGEIQAKLESENIIRISESGAGIFVQLARLLKAGTESAAMREINEASQGMTDFRTSQPGRGELALVAEMRRLAVDMNIAALPDPQAVNNLMSLLKAADDDVRSWTYLRLGQYLETQSDNIELMMRIDPVAKELRQQFPNDFERIMEQAKAFWWQTIFEFLSTRAMGTDQNQTTGYIYDGQKAIRAFLENGTFEQRAAALADAVGSRGLRLGLGKLLDSVSQTPQAGLVMSLAQMMGLELMLDKQRQEMLLSQITLGEGDDRLMGSRLISVDLVKIFGDRGDQSTRALLNRIAANPQAPAPLRHAALESLAEWNALDVSVLRGSIPTSVEKLTADTAWKAVVAIEALGYSPDSEVSQILSGLLDKIGKSLKPSTGRQDFQRALARVAIDALAGSMARGNRSAFEALQSVVNQKHFFLSPLAMDALERAIELTTKPGESGSVFLVDVLKLAMNLFSDNSDLGKQAVRTAGKLGELNPASRIELQSVLERVRDDAARPFGVRVTAVEALQSLGFDSELASMTIPQRVIDDYKNKRSRIQMMEDLSSHNLSDALLSKAALIQQGAQALDDLIKQTADTRNRSDRREKMVEVLGKIGDALSGSQRQKLMTHLKSLFEKDSDFSVKKTSARQLVGLGEYQYILGQIPNLFESLWDASWGDDTWMKNLVLNPVGLFWDSRSANPRQRRFDEVLQSAREGDWDSLALVKWLAAESDGNTFENRQNAIQLFGQSGSADELVRILRDNPDHTLMPMVIHEFVVMAKRFQKGPAQEYHQRVYPIYMALKSIIEQDNYAAEYRGMAARAAAEIFPVMDQNGDPYYQIVHDYGEDVLMMFRDLVGFLARLADSNEPQTLRDTAVNLLADRLNVPWTTNAATSYGDTRAAVYDTGNYFANLTNRDAQNRALAETIMGEIVEALRSGRAAVGDFNAFLNDKNSQFRSWMAKFFSALKLRDSGIEASNPQGLLEALNETNYDNLLGNVRNLLASPEVAPERVADALLDVMLNGMTWESRENAASVFRQEVLALADFENRPDVLARFLATYALGDPDMQFTISSIIAEMKISPSRVVDALRLGQFDGYVNFAELNGIKGDANALFEELINANVIDHDGHILRLPHLRDQLLAEEYKDVWPEIYAVLTRNHFSLLQQINNLMLFSGAQVTSFQSREGKVVFLEFSILQAMIPWEMPGALATDATFLKDYWKMVLGILNQLYEKEVSSSVSVPNPQRSMLNLPEGSVPNLEDVRSQLEEWLNDTDLNKVGQAAQIFKYLMDHGIVDPGAPSWRPLAQAAQNARMGLGNAGDWSPTYRLIKDAMGETRFAPETLSNEDIDQLLRGVSKEDLDRLGLGSGNLYVENNRYMLLLSTADLLVIIAEDRTRGLTPDKISGLLNEARGLLEQARIQMESDLRAFSPFSRDAQMKRDQFQTDRQALDARIAAVAGEVGRTAQRDESAQAAQSFQTLLGDFVSQMQGEEAEARILNNLVSGQIVSDADRIQLGNYLKATAEKMITSQGDVPLPNSIWHQLRAAAEDLIQEKNISDAVSTVQGVIQRAQVIVEIDLAMVSPTPEETVQEDSAEVGGIDLNPALMNLRIRRDARGVPLPVSAQPLETIRIEGFVPVLIHMTPVLSLPLLLGLGDESPSLEIGYLP